MTTGDEVKPRRGRPLLHDEKMSRQVAFRVEADTIAMLDRLCADEKVSFSEFMRLMIRDYLADRRAAGRQVPGPGAPRLPAGSRVLGDRHRGALATTQKAGTA